VSAALATATPELPSCREPFRCTLAPCVERPSRHRSIPSRHGNLRCGGMGQVRQGDRLELLHDAMGGLLAIPLWYLVARPVLVIAHNPHWTYDLGPAALAGNYAVYALTFPSPLVTPSILVDPAITIKAYPLLMSVRVQPAAHVVVAFVAVLCAVVVGARVFRQRWHLHEEVRWAAAGLAIFFLSLAPTVILKDRLLLYYGYFGFFGLSLSILCLLRPLARRIAPWARSAHGPAASAPSTGPSSQR